MQMLPVSMVGSLNAVLVMTVKYLIRPFLSPASVMPCAIHLVTVVMTSVALDVFKIMVIEHFVVIIIIMKLAICSTPRYIGRDYHTVHPCWTDRWCYY